MSDDDESIVNAKSFYRGGGDIVNEADDIARGETLDEETSEELDLGIRIRWVLKGRIRKTRHCK